MNYYEAIMGTSGMHCMDMELRSLLKALLTVMTYSGSDFSFYDPRIGILCNVRGKPESENFQVENFLVEIYPRSECFLPVKEISVLQVDHDGWVTVYRPGYWEDYVLEKLLPGASEKMQASKPIVHRAGSMNYYEAIMGKQNMHCMDMKLRSLLRALLTVVTYSERNHTDSWPRFYMDAQNYISCGEFNKPTVENLHVKTCTDGEDEICVLQIDNEGWVTVYNPGSWEDYVQEKLYPEARDKMQASGLARLVTPPNFAPIDDAGHFSSSL